MSWSLNIGKVAGTVVRIHLTFLLFLAWIFFAEYASGGAENSEGSGFVNCDDRAMTVPSRTTCPSLLANIL